MEGKKFMPGKLRKLLTYFFRPPSRSGNYLRNARRVLLEVELLEDRVAPVVGATTLPAEVPRGGDYDGVALITPGISTGSLFRTGQGQGFGHHILTAAHVLGDLLEVDFHMPREGTNGVNIKIFPDKQNQIPHPRYKADALSALNDIGIILLADQDDLSPNRLLVAPYRAQQYELYEGSNEVGKEFTLVGYGRTGVGETGSEEGSGGTKRQGQNRFDGDGTALLNEVQLVMFSQNENFTVRFRGKNSGNIPGFKATAAEFQNALENIEGLQGNVQVQTIPDRPGWWWVTFINDLGEENVPSLRSSKADIYTLRKGSQECRCRGPNVNSLVFDFDNGKDSNDFYGLLN